MMAYVYPALAIIAICLLQGVRADWLYNAEQTPPYPLRYVPACANNAMFSPSTVTSLLLGGYVNSTYYSDTWTGTSTYAAPTPTFAQANQSGAPTPRLGAFAVYTSNQSLLWLGGYETSQILTSVSASTDNGVTWSVVNSGAPWIGRANPAVTLMAADNQTVVLVAGAIADAWISPNRGLTWLQVSTSVPMGAVQGAALVGLSDFSLVLTGGANGSNISNAVWLSSSSAAGTWALLPTPPFSPRYHHSMTADTASLIYVYGGCIAYSTVFMSCPSDSSLYVSANRGYSWSPIQQTAAATGTVAPIVAQSFACLTVLLLNNGSRALIVYNGVDSNATIHGVFSGQISINQTYNQSIPAQSSTGTTIVYSSSSSTSSSAAISANVSSSSSISAVTPSSSSSSVSAAPRSSSSVSSSSVSSPSSTGKNSAVSAGVDALTILLCVFMSALLSL